MNQHFDPQDFIERLPQRLGHLAGKAYLAVIAVGEEAFELFIALWILIMVERAYGQPGVGIYAYLMALLYVARYIADFGVSRHLEHEIAVIGQEDELALRRLIAAGYQTILITGGIAAILLVTTAGFDTAHTRIEERLPAYLIVGFILPVANLNHCKLSILQGMGRHARVARLSMVRFALILVNMLVLTRFKVPPSFLPLAVLLSELAMAFLIRRHVRFHGLKALFQHPDRIAATLRRGQAYLFTDNGLDVLLNLDLFVLGLFVSAWELGVYAEAAVIVRFFLVIPVGMKPILRRRYNMMAARHEIAALHTRVRRITAALFSLHALLAVSILLTFPTVLNFFFETHGEEMLSFKIFAVFMPGLLFYSAFSAQEPLYEAIGEISYLRGLTLIASGTNLVLTFYLVPFAGYYGAAAATMITMLVYFVLFGRGLTSSPGFDKATYIVAGLAVYLVFALFDWWAPGGASSSWLAPLLLAVLFYLVGLFGVRRLPSVSDEATT